MKKSILLTLLLLPAIVAARRPFVRPPFLKPGDTVGIVAPSGKLPEQADTALVRLRFAEWGLGVKFGDHCFDRDEPYFAGTDSARAADFRRMIADTAVRAIIAYRGGYGSVRLLPLVDLEPLLTHPKWIVGFSDVTMWHLALYGLGVESLHATMPGSFDFEGEDTSAESLRQALFGLVDRIDVAPHPCNTFGTATGRLAGGNLTLVALAAGTPEQLPADEPTVLFIEETGEFPYGVDRLMQHLRRSGTLDRVRAIVVGDISLEPDNGRFGVADACEILAPYTRDLGIPVVFGLPAGHGEQNFALYMGRPVTVHVDASGAVIRFLDATEVPASSASAQPVEK